MWLRTLEGCTWMGWMSATVSTSMPFFSSSCLISSVSARIDTAGGKEARITDLPHVNVCMCFCSSSHTLNHHVRLRDGGEPTVQRVNLSRSQKTLKETSGRR